jgi:hypothetical protein
MFAIHRLGPLLQVKAVSCRTAHENEPVADTSGVVFGRYFFQYICTYPLCINVICIHA